MADSFTPNFGLRITDPTSVVDVQTQLNDNWNKIDDQIRGPGIPLFANTTVRDLAYEDSPFPICVVGSSYESGEVYRKRNNSKDPASWPEWIELGTKGKENTSYFQGQGGAYYQWVDSAEAVVPAWQNHSLAPSDGLGILNSGEIKFNKPGKYGIQASIDVIIEINTKVDFSIGLYAGIKAKGDIRANRRFLQADNVLLISSHIHHDIPYEIVEISELDITNNKNSVEVIGMADPYSIINYQVFTQIPSCRISITKLD